MKTILKIFLIATFLSNSSIQLLASDTNSEWHEGVVVLDNKDVLNGMVSISEKYNVLQIKSHSKIQSIPAWQIQKVTVHDPKLKTLRHFIVIPSRVKSVEIHQFYEIIIKGEIMLVSKDKTYKYTELVSTDLITKIFPKAVKEFSNNKDFYFFDGKNLIPIDKFRKIVLPAFRRHFESEIDGFIEEENLNINYPKDQVLLMKHFNKLYQDKVILAKG